MKNKKESTSGALSDLIEWALRVERDALYSASESNATSNHTTWQRGYANGVRALRTRLEGLRDKGCTEIV